jgi:predicted Zn-dependent protease
MTRSPIPYVRLAEVAVAQNNLPAAAAQLKKAIELAPDLVSARTRLVEVQVAGGDATGALTAAQALQKKRPDLALGDRLEGDAQASRQAWPAAATAYRRSLDKTPDPEVAAKLHAALDKGAAKTEAGKFAAKWLAQHPNDATFLFYLAGAEMLQGQLPEAARHFETVAKLNPSHAPTQNNLAWIMMKLGQPGAMAHAEKANALQPRQPAFMDTLSMAQEADGQLARAVETQKAAVDLQPANHALRLRLAKLYLKADDKQHGRAELERLAKTGREFPGQQEVAALLKTIS